MKIYHGSLYEITKPNIDKSRPNTGFGKGFYTTTNFEQAKSWALSKQKSSKELLPAIVNIFEIDDHLLQNIKYQTIIFNSPDADWLSFVVNCRRGIEHGFDIVFGAVANDKIYTTITLYESQILTAEETVARLKVNDYYNQISFHSKCAVSELSFIESVLVG